MLHSSASLLSNYLSIYLSIYLTIELSIYLSTFRGVYRHPNADFRVSIYSSASSLSLSLLTPLTLYSLSLSLSLDICIHMRTCGWSIYPSDSLLCLSLSLSLSLSVAICIYMRTCGWSIYSSASLLPPCARTRRRSVSSKPSKVSTSVSGRVFPPSQQLQLCSSTAFTCRQSE